MSERAARHLDLGVLQTRDLRTYEGAFADTREEPFALDASANDLSAPASVRATREPAPRPLDGSQALREARETEDPSRELEIVFQNVRDAVVSWRTDGTITLWNPGAERLYGAPKHEAIGTTFVRFVSPEDAADLKRRQDDLLAGTEMQSIVITRVRADGREIEIAESLYAIRDAHGAVHRFVSVARDPGDFAHPRRSADTVRAGDGMPSAKQARSAGMREALHTAELVARESDATVLILGETGVGKSWLARRIHNVGPRADKPFFELNCASLGSQLVESELFGHERGAFTGALSQKRGLVEIAADGTLFLDEIGELPLGVQANLLTFIDTRTFRRVGGNRMLSASVRLVAATNVDLKAAVEAGKFRRDLYYRIHVVPITLPPLRERRQAIPDLVRTLLAEFSQKRGRRHTSLSRDAMAALARYHWPGNIRELRNVLERALIMSRGHRIELEHLPPELREAPSAIMPTDSALSLETQQRDHIVHVLRQATGNRTRAAKLLGISRSTLNRKLAEMGEGGR